MKKWLRSLIFVVCMIVLIGVYNTIGLAEELAYTEFNPLYFVASIYYVPESLPEEMQINEGADFVYLNSEDVKVAYARFLSGDEFLKDAIFFKYNNVSGHMCVRIDDTELVSPGHAVFEIYCESDHYQNISEFELYVFDYREDKLYSKKWHNGMRFDANVGDSFILDELFAKGMKFNLEELKKTKQIREKNTNSGSISYYIPDLCNGISMEHDFWTVRNTIHIEDYGVHQFSVQMRYGNYIYTLPVTIVVTEPGKNDTDYNQNSVESVESNQHSNTMVKSGVLDDVLLETMAHDAGFIVPVPEGENWYIDQGEINWDGYCVSSKHGSYEKDIIVDAKVLKLKGFMRDFFSEMYAIVANAPSEEDVRFRHFISEWITLDDGHPALLCVSKHVDNNDMFDSFIGYLYYARNDRLLRVRVYSIPWVPAYNRQVTMEDMKKIAAKVSYDESEAPITIADGALSLSSAGAPVAVTAGKNVAFTVTFANQDRVKKNGNDAIVWSVGKADTDESVEGVSIDAKGQLKVDKKLVAPVDLQVKASSEVFGTSATYNIIAMPVVSKVNLDSSTLFFYVGTEDPQMVKASLEPTTVPPVGLTWTPVKEGIIEITPVEDGVVSIKPLAVGKTDIAVKEPGGKNAKLTVNVVAPVESVELKANGAVKAGGKVKIAATLSPKNVGNKTIQWSIDVDEDIAKIDDKGQLTIAKEASSGTKITVTCTAIGAPKPVVATMEIEVP